MCLVFPRGPRLRDRRRLRERPVPLDLRHLRAVGFSNTGTVYVDSVTWYTPDWARGRPDTVGVLPFVTWRLKPRQRNTQPACPDSEVGAGRLGARVLGALWLHQGSCSQRREV